MNCQKHLFDLPEEVHYLNCAAYGPLLKAAMQAGEAGIRQKAHPFQITPDLHFEGTLRVQQLLARLVQVSDPQRFAIIPAVSYGLAIVAANLHRLPNLAQKNHILTIENEFPNFTYAFERVAEKHALKQQVVAAPATWHNRGQQWNDDLLAAINTETALVAIPHVHWIQGVVFDVAAVAKRCREVGALIVVDGTQSVGAMPFAAEQWDVDALVVGAYKWLLGPYSIGFAYLGSFFEEGVPLEESWMTRLHSEKFSELTQYQPNYRPKAQRYHMGEFSQFIQMPMLETSVQQILDWGVENIQTYARHLLTPLVEAVEMQGGHAVEASHRSGHLVGIQLPPNTDNVQLAARLKEANVYVSNRGSGLRISANVFNNATDVEAFLNCL